MNNIWKMPNLIGDAIPCVVIFEHEPAEPDVYLAEGVVVQEVRIQLKNGEWCDISIDLQENVLQRLEQDALFYIECERDKA